MSRPAAPSTAAAATASRTPPADMPAGMARGLLNKKRSLVECHSLIDVGELVLKASLSRKASNSILDFHRLDYPEMDPPGWNRLLPIRQENNEVKVRGLPLDFHLKEPYASDYEDNYRRYSGQ